MKPRRNYLVCNPAAEERAIMSNGVKKNLSFDKKIATGWPNDDEPKLIKKMYRNGAGNGDRTRDPQLGRLMLYHLSYSRL